MYMIYLSNSKHAASHNVKLMSYKKVKKTIIIKFMRNII